MTTATTILWSLIALQGFMLACPTIIIKAKPGTWLYKWMGRANAMNWPCLILIKSDLIELVPILCQEWYEQEYRRFIPNAMAVAFLRRSQQAMEVMGHEIEVQAAVKLLGRKEKPYRKAEALILTSYKCFAGEPVENIIEAMEKVRAQAKVEMDDILAIKKVRKFTN